MKQGLGLHVRGEAVRREEALAGEGQVEGGQVRTEAPAARRRAHCFKERELG